MEIDLHIHTNRYSGCSNLDPLALVRRARRIGLDGIALTEHGIRWTDEDIAARTSYAVKIGAVTDPAWPLALMGESPDPQL